MMFVLFKNNTTVLFKNNTTVFFKNNTTYATSGAGTTYPSTAHEFTLFLVGFFLSNL